MSQRRDLFTLDRFKNRFKRNQSNDTTAVYRDDPVTRALQSDYGLESIFAEVFIRDEITGLYSSRLDKR